MHPEGKRRVYFRGELPPRDAEFFLEERIDAKSKSVELRPSERGRGWALCHHDLEDQLVDRLTQEVDRLGGCCAQVVDERINPKYNAATHEYWLEARYKYVLFTRQAKPTSAA